VADRIITLGGSSCDCVLSGEVDDMESVAKLDSLGKIQASWFGSRGRVPNINMSNITHKQKSLDTAR